MTMEHLIPIFRTKTVVVNASDKQQKIAYWQGRGWSYVGDLNNESTESCLTFCRIITEG